MSTSELSDAVLALIVNYGAVAVGLVLLLAALGAPLPATVAVLASGAFVQQGVLSPYSTVAIAFVFVLAGDSLSFGIGRLLRGPLSARFGQSASWLKAEASFERHGGLAVYLTRWLLTPLSVPTNLAAGGSHYRYWRFLAFAAAGEVTWLLVYGGLGYAFGSQWEYVSAVVSDLGGSLFGVLILAIGVIWLLRQTLRSARADEASAGS